MNEVLHASMDNMQRKVKSNDDAVKSRREAVADRVVSTFGQQLPDLKVLCFFDDVDDEALKSGSATRGLYAPANYDIWRSAPDYLQGEIKHVSGTELEEVVFDHVIYVHGSTCEDEVGQTMTFAHELQHFIQHSNQLMLWAAGSLVTHLHKNTIADLGLQWRDVPHECEARIVAKRISEAILGKERVQEYIRRRIAMPANESDRIDWEFIETIDPAAPYNLEEETYQLFRRIKRKKAELDFLLRNCKGNPDFKDVDLNELCGEE